MLLETCRNADRARVEAAKLAGRPVYGMVTNRAGGRGERRYLSVRTDGVVNCQMGKVDLRYGQILRVDGDEVGIRPATTAELARIMGIRPGYVMPSSVAQAARLAGEGVAVPVVRWLSRVLLEPIAAAPLGAGTGWTSPSDASAP